LFFFSFSPHQALSATHNKIRDLYKDSFKHYTYLKYLYLDNNMISYVENGTFDPLQRLEVICLSHNALESVPAGILQLPKLRKLFVDNNRLNGGGGFAGAPVSETLESLSLAICHLEALPPLGMYPKLLELNISGNELKIISPQQLAPLCSLRLLDLRENPMLFKDSEGCECQLLVTWITQMNIYFAEIPLNCSSETGRHSKIVFCCI
jgi:Leucine-rich repeat (LRR) protein